MTKYLDTDDLAGRGVCRSKPTLYRWIRDRGFPKPIKLSPGCSVWREDEVEAWLAAREAERDKVAA